MTKKWFVASCFLFFTSFSLIASDEDIGEVTNLALLTSINEVEANRSIENVTRMIEEINKATYVVAIFPNQLKENKRSDDGIVTINAGQEVSYMTIKSTDGNMYLPIFTDLQAKDYFIEEESEALVYPAKELWKKITLMDNIYGVAINPGLQNVPLEFELIKQLNPDVFGQKQG
ncbi:SseB family protein [Photobacterium kasasachensis]|uniref:SseB family protein n=2 Tax=Photobacterium TaxID=657 RepID=UPI003D0E7756